MLQVTVGLHGPGAAPGQAVRWRGWQDMRALGSAFWLRRRETPAAGDASQHEHAATAAPSHRQSRPDTRAFDAFFTQHEQTLYGYLRRMVSSDEVALELAQESFFRAWQHFDEVSAYDRPGAWLFRIATNLAISHLRRRASVPFADLAHGHDEDDSLAEERFADPHDFAGDWAERDAIGRTLRQLPERQRAALLLRAVHGLSCDEIAQALGLSSVAARKVLSRARERFRTLYEADQSGTHPAPGSGPGSGPRDEPSVRGGQR